MFKVLKRRKKLILIAVIVLACLAGGFFYYYKYLAKGTLVINSQAKDIMIQINGNEYLVSDSLKLKLKPGNYNMIVTKNDQMPSYYNNIELKALKSTNISVNISEAKLIAELINENIGIGEISNKNVTGFYYTTFDPTESRFLLINNKTIYYFPYDSDIEIMKKNQLTKFADIPLEENAIILDVKWSDQVNRAIIKVIENDLEKNYLYTLNSQKLELIGENITEACWLESDQIGFVSLTAEDQKLYILTKGQKKLIEKVNSKSKNLFCSRDKLAYYFLQDNDVFLRVYSLIDDKAKNYLRACLKTNHFGL